MTNLLADKCQKLFAAYAGHMAIAAALLVPIKLSLCLIFLVPLNLLWLGKNSSRLSEEVKRPEFSHLHPLIIFTLISIYSGFFGIDAVHSSLACLSLLFFSFSAFAVCDAIPDGKEVKLALALIAGQSVAGLHSILEGLVPALRHRIFLGEVTESGQIALTLLLTLGLAHVACLNKTRKPISLLLCLAVLSLALLFNLKRGPWLGVGFASLLFFARFSRRLLFPVALTVIAIFLLVTPVRERLLQSYDHFSIAGGRQVIWEIGSELTLRYPLGIGFNNSYILRKFSTEIPEELRHFHNNFLNILVETGWLALSVFLWWIIRLLRVSWTTGRKTENRVIAYSIGCAVLSWQLAGLVEYNFGDSEIFLVVMVILGILASIRKRDYADRAPEGQ